MLVSRQDRRRLLWGHLGPSVFGAFEFLKCTRTPAFTTSASLPAQPQPLQRHKTNKRMPAIHGRHDDDRCTQARKHFFPHEKLQCHQNERIHALLACSCSQNDCVLLGRAALDIKTQSGCSLGSSCTAQKHCFACEKQRRPSKRACIHTLLACGCPQNGQAVRH